MTKNYKIFLKNIQKLVDKIDVLAYNTFVIPQQLNGGATGC